MSFGHENVSEITLKRVSQIACDRVSLNFGLKEKRFEKKSWIERNETDKNLFNRKLSNWFRNLKFAHPSEKFSTFRNLHSSFFFEFDIVLS